MLIKDNHEQNIAKMTVTFLFLLMCIYEKTDHQRLTGFIDKSANVKKKKFLKILKYESATFLFIRRMNVALTRARHHLLIVGNLKNLSRNSLWAKVLQHCEGLSVSDRVFTY